MGDTELTLERDDVDEERIGELVELERDLAETRRRAQEIDDDDSPELTMPSVGEPRVPVTGTVTDVQRAPSAFQRDKAEVTVHIGDEDHVFEFAWPDPADFDDNDLVRLLRGKDIAPERLADLRGCSVTVLPTADGEYELRVPQDNPAARGIHWAAAKACRYRLLVLRDKDLAFERKLRPSPVGWVVLPAISAIIGCGILAASTPASSTAEGIASLVGFLLAGMGGLVLGLEGLAAALLLIVFALLKFNEKVWPF